MVGIHFIVIVTINTLTMIQNQGENRFQIVDYPETVSNYSEYDLNGGNHDIITLAETFIRCS